MILILYLLKSAVVMSYPLGSNGKFTIALRRSGLYNNLEKALKIIVLCFSKIKLKENARN